jgi:hypothetical protein
MYKILARHTSDRTSSIQEIVKTKAQAKSYVSWKMRYYRERGAKIHRNGDFVTADFETYGISYLILKVEGAEIEELAPFMRDGA